ncbi:MAG: GNAT family N-acetyltransferase [Bacteroidetes bacterium]|nr:GNAT family N-acetyltransferase [Bacteroidota bacterium]
MKYLLNGEQTERLIFRKIQESDFDQWLTFFRDPKTSEHWIEEKETPEIECAKWYKKQFGRYENNLGGMNALVEKQNGKLVGHCGLLVQIVDGVNELEIAYSILPEYWNRGYAFEAATFCRDSAFQNEWTDSLISIISLTNIASEKVAIKNGMVKEKTTTYKGNKVNIFRILKTEWSKLLPIDE